MALINPYIHFNVNAEQNLHFTNQYCKNIDVKG
jgi:hypothetical protein